MPSDWLAPLKTSMAGEASINGSLATRMAAVVFGGGCFYIILSAALRVQGEFQGKRKDRLCFLLLESAKARVIAWQEDAML